MASTSEGGFDLVAVLGDQIEFQTWYEATAPRVYAYLFSRTGSITTAEELTQETFLEVVRHPRTYDGRADPVPWLVGIARHRLLAHLRHLRRDAARAGAAVIELRLTSDEPAWRGAELRDDILGALDRLPTDQRAALLLRFVDGLSVREVAAALGRSEDATESLIRRARTTFETAYGRGVDD